jgi:hypothetical protein
MLRMPLSGSAVMQSVAVRYGATSNPGVEIGTGRLAKPRPETRRSSPLMMTSWQGGEATITGAIGLAIAFSQSVPISATARPISIA